MSVLPSLCLVVRGPFCKSCARPLIVRAISSLHMNCLYFQSSVIRLWELFTKILKPVWGYIVLRHIDYVSSPSFLEILLYARTVKKVQNQCFIYPPNSIQRKIKFRVGLKYILIMYLCNNTLYQSKVFRTQRYVLSKRKKFQPQISFCAHDIHVLVNQVIFWRYISPSI